jgi:hypothetical protein
MTRWLWQLKWALVIAIFAGPALAYWGYTESNRIQRIAADGVEITAVVNGGIVHHGRYGSVDYSLELSWVDAQGARLDRSIDISGDYAERIIHNDAVMIDHVQIKYLAAESGEPIVVLDDASEQLRIRQFDIWAGIIAAIAGLLIAPVMFWLERRTANKQEEDIDATLARMRAGQPQQ